jgi:hypothetical protein
MKLKTIDGGAAATNRPGGKRFTCLLAGQSSATELLRSCPVVTASGQSLGRVRSVLVDTRTRQLRYVMLAPHQGKSPVAIPWHALYFDSALVRLVYYTFS